MLLYGVLFVFVYFLYVFIFLYGSYMFLRVWYEKYVRKELGVQFFFGRVSGRRAVYFGIKRNAVLIRSSTHTLPRRFLFTGRWGFVAFLYVTQLCKKRPI